MRSTTTATTSSTSPTTATPEPRREEVRLDAIERGTIYVSGKTRRDQFYSPARADINRPAIADYAQAMDDGAQFPPIIVFYDGKKYWLADGLHRVRAADHLGMETVTAEVYAGSEEDAKWFSFSTNTTHGVRRTHEDLGRVIQGALRHPHATGMSDNALAKHVGVTGKTIAHHRMRNALYGASSEIPKIEVETASDEECAQLERERLERFARFVKRPSPSAVESPPPQPAPDEPTVRTVIRKGRTYRMHVDRIGKAVRSEPVKKAEAATVAFANTELGIAAAALSRAVETILRYRHLKPEELVVALVNYGTETAFTRLEEAYVFLGLLREREPSRRSRPAGGGKAEEKAKGPNRKHCGRPNPAGGGKARGKG